MKKLFLFSVMLLGLAGCQPEKQAAGGFTLTSFLQQQAVLLKNARVSKTSTLNGVTETQVVAIPNWENELEMFRQADLLKGSLRYRYNTEKLSGNGMLYTVQADARQLPVKSLRLTYGKDSTEITGIEAVIEKKNYLYESERRLQMTLQKNEKGILQIKNYQITGSGKLVFSAPTVFSVKAEVL